MSAPSVARRNARPSGRIYDFVGIGIGPFNLGLACLSVGIKALDGLFLDQNPGFDWHPGLMLEDATLQTPFLSDLVTLADPTHPMSVLNYLKRQGRLYSFYIRENFFLPRQEYNRYCQWAARQLDNLRWRTRVEDLYYDDAEACYEVIARETDTGNPCRLRARRLVLGTGPTPWWPSCCDGLMGSSRAVTHASDYLHHRERLKKAGSITVVGSGQSAAEIFLDLLQGIDRHGYALTWVTRSPRFVPLEYSKLTLEMTSPEYTRYFQALAPATRDALIASQANLYKGINEALINDIYDLLYRKRLVLDGRDEDLSRRVRLLTNSELIAAGTAGPGLRLDFHHPEQARTFSLDTEALVLATGYRYRLPAFVSGIASRLRFDAAGRFDVASNYTVDRNCREVFVQNVELHTHGFVAPDLGMACYRNAHIIKAMTGVEHYPIEERIAFQQFGVPEQAFTVDRRRAAP